MPWTETTPGIWHRPIGENEKFIKFIGDRAHGAGREHWSVTASATFSLSKHLPLTQLSIKCLEAWRALRFDHPSIACVAEKDRLAYCVPTQESVIQWANETFTIHGGNACVQDVIADFKPSDYAVGHFFPNERTFILHLSHWRTDGYGALQLVDAFLDKLCRVVGGENSSLDWGKEVRRLTLSVEEVLDLPSTATPEILEATQDCMRTLSYAKGAVGVANLNEEPGAPAGTRSVSLSLTEPETDAVLQACSRRNISLVSAVHASCAALTYHMASPDNQAKHYTSTMRFSLRPYLPLPHCTAYAAAGLYTGGYMIQVPASQSWLANAKQYEEKYEVGTTPEFLASRRQYATEVLHTLQRNAPAPSPLPSEIDISSVGDAGLLVSPLRSHSGTVLGVSDVSIGVDTLTPQIYCFLWAFGGRLNFHLVYNEAYYGAERVSDMVEKLRDILMVESGLSGGF